MGGAAIIHFVFVVFPVHIAAHYNHHDIMSLTQRRNKPRFFFFLFLFDWQTGMRDKNKVWTIQKVGLLLILGISFAFCSYNRRGHHQVLTKTNIQTNKRTNWRTKTRIERGTSWRCPLKTVLKCARMRKCVLGQRGQTHGCGQLVFIYLFIYFWIFSLIIQFFFECSCQFDSQ